jgi:cation transport protein ChaC
LSDEAPKSGSVAVPTGDGLLKREHFSAEGVRRYAEQLAKLGEGRLMDETAREATRRAALAEIPAGADAWVFGYGSLMWNPIIRTRDSRKTRLAGFHRHFCLKLDLGRGTPDAPGLMLGLDARDGAHCVGIAHRVAASDLESETEILWYREMMTGAYRPRWLAAEIEGLGPARVLAFVINRDHPRYEGRVPEAEIVRRIAASEGALGTNRDYLYRTARHLAELGIEDEEMRRLETQVRARAGASPSESVTPSETSGRPA